ncbi:hypothetical protein KIW84_070957 [Lathyrus oleraceus]|uniref:NADH-ubiquinone oxidoreductase chain 6 n=1 Tax=Pisum sativum TaxID=3888 RepID=A0A9D4ZV99_PEA|nr:hypothetical protein KIW84_MT0003 [Pisum sativum]KAI5383798.1 hypothetical protein KIW84_070957 [Pisum sativum]
MTEVACAAPSKLDSSTALYSYSLLRAGKTLFLSGGKAFWTKGTMILSVLSSPALVSGLMVARAKNPVHSVLFPIPVFRDTSGLLILLGLDFSAMIFPVVHIGAIAVSFLFVVMMFHIQIAEIHEEVLRYLPEDYNEEDDRPTHDRLKGKSPGDIGSNPIREMAVIYNRKNSSAADPAQELNTADQYPLLHPLKDLLPVLIDGDRHEGQSFRLSEFPSTMPEMFSDALRSGVEVAYHKE